MTTSWTSLMDERNHSAVDAAVADANDVDAGVGMEGELRPTGGRDVDGGRLEGRHPVLLGRGLLRITRDRQGHVLALAAGVLLSDRRRPVRVVARRGRPLARRDVPSRGGPEAAERLGSRRRVDEDLALVAVLVEVGRIAERRSRAGAVAVGRPLAVGDDGYRPDLEELLALVALLVVARAGEGTLDRGAADGQRGTSDHERVVVPAAHVRSRHGGAERHHLAGDPAVVALVGLPNLVGLVDAGHQVVVAVRNSGGDPQLDAPSELIARAEPPDPRLAGIAPKAEVALPRVVLPAR